MEIEVSRCNWGDPRNLGQLLDLNQVTSHLDQFPYQFSGRVIEKSDSSGSLLERTVIDGLHDNRHPQYLH